MRHGRGTVRARGAGPRRYAVGDGGGVGSVAGGGGAGEKHVGDAALVLVCRAGPDAEWVFGTFQGEE